MAREIVAIPLRPESARYGASMLFLGGLWTGPGVWMGFQSFLAHRGWDGAVLDLRSVDGGIAARAACVAAEVRSAARPSVLVAHDLGAAIALEVARQTPVAGIALLAPLLAGHPAFRRLLLRWRILSALMRGRRVPPPEGSPVLRLEELPDGSRGRLRSDLAREPARAVRDAVWGKGGVLPRAPALVVTGGRDRLVPPSSGATLARALGAELREIATSGHWLICGPGWEQGVALVHRWAIRRLGEDALDFYADAMSERGDRDDDE
ncbi:MAG: alpha/beta fold hydrolase [Candidatus Binatia bacterium]